MSSEGLVPASGASNNVGLSELALAKPLVHTVSPRGVLAGKTVGSRVAVYDFNQLRNGGDLTVAIMIHATNTDGFSKNIARAVRKISAQPELDFSESDYVPDPSPVYGANRNDARPRSPAMATKRNAPQGSVGPAALPAGGLAISFAKSEKMSTAIADDVEGQNQLPHRVTVYVDGLNLYYGLKSLDWRRCRWIDLHRYGERRLRSEQSLAFVRYFTARFQPPADDPDQYVRHDTYLKAMEILPDLTIGTGTICPTPEPAGGERQPGNG